MGPMEKVAVRVVFSILSELTLTEWTLNESCTELQKNVNNNASTNERENSRANDIFTTSYVIFFSAT